MNVTDAWSNPSGYVDGRSADELVRFIANGGAQPGSNVHAAVLAAIQIRIAQEQDAVAVKQLATAEAQRDAALAAASWSKVQGVATAAATLIALVALLIAAFG